MSVWERYPKENRDKYIKYLQVYGALSNLFRQKKGDIIPYLDSKFQETVFAKTFNSENVDISNTPHDVLSVFGDERIGVGIKTWMGSNPSYQKVMQVKSYQDEINDEFDEKNLEYVIAKISEIKNLRLKSDHNRLGLLEDGNIYHYVTRDKGTFTINECAYPLIDLDRLRDVKYTRTSLSWSDGRMDYKYTFGDSQIWQRFDADKYGTLVLDRFKVEIIENPFDFLLQAHSSFLDMKTEVQEELEEAYLPLYSYRTKEVEKKSGLNAWNAAPKSKASNTPRPLNEIYIPIPRKFHEKCPDFFTKNIFEKEEEIKRYSGSRLNKPQVRFYLQLPNGRKIPSLVTQENMKALQSGSNTEKDSSGKRYGQSALGQWLLVDVLGLKDRELVTRDWLRKKGTDSVRLWRKRGDYSVINIDFAPVGSFEAFMRDEPIPEDEDNLV